MLLGIESQQRKRKTKQVELQKMSGIKGKAKDGLTDLHKLAVRRSG
jgi:hypothetical protein